MRIVKFVALIAIFVGGSAVTNAQENYKDKAENLSYQNEDFYEVKKYTESELKFKKEPKNIILLIGDGMGVAQVFTGLTANKGELNLCNFKHIGFSKTQSSDNYVTDSAAGGTALASGVKTTNGTIGLDANGKPAKTILEYAEDNQKATGLVATSSITHATPASFIAHQPSRTLYEEIAADFLNTDIDVFIGGGAAHFKNRKDGKDLTKDLSEKGYQIVYSMEEAEKIQNNGRLAVFTADEHNDDYQLRGNMLVDATNKAISTLSADLHGFFLMVEGSQIDWGGHQNSTSFVAGEMLDFDKVIGEVLKFAIEDKETLVIVTADHETGGMAVTGGDMSTGSVNGGFVTGDHTGIMVPVFAIGPGAEEFMGIYENTEVFDKMMKLWKFKK